MELSRLVLMTRKHQMPATGRQVSVGSYMELPNIDPAELAADIKQDSGLRSGILVLGVKFSDSAVLAFT